MRSEIVRRFQMVSEHTNALKKQIMKKLDDTSLSIQNDADEFISRYQCYTCFCQCYTCVNIML